MKRNPDWMEVRQRSRATAESLVASVSPVGAEARPADVLLHELLVNKVEFEAQIEELKRAHSELEQTRDRLQDLYEFSPVGYASITRDCVISEINLQAAGWLGVDRRKLLNARFSKFVSFADRSRWDRLFIDLIGGVGGARKSFVLELVRADASTLCVYVMGQRREVEGSTPSLRLTLVDLSDIRRAEEERRTTTATSGLL